MPQTTGQDKTLTGHLANHARDSHTRATSSHPFLVAAGNGSISHHLLAFYLSQDRIYASYAYPKFVAGLIRRLPAVRRPHDASPSSPDKILSLLAFSLTNVLKEVELFDTTASKYQLSLDVWKTRKGTRDYVAEMAFIAEWAETWEEGMIFLWAMEKVYLDAWTAVRTRLESNSPSTITPTIQALTTISTNWSSPAFVDFVNQLGDIVDSIGTGQVKDDPSNGSKRAVSRKRAEEIWERVLELEEAFWPTEDEVAQYRV